MLGKRSPERPQPMRLAPSLFPIPTIAGVIKTQEEAEALAREVGRAPAKKAIGGHDMWVKRLPVREVYVSANLLQKIPDAGSWMVLPDSQFEVSGNTVLQVFPHEGDAIVGLPPAVTCANLAKIEADLHNSIAYLKERRLIHRDIKPDNLIWTGRQVKLIDLDNLIQLREGEEYKDTAFGGSDEYIPEDARGGRFALEDGYDAATDAYAVNVTLQMIRKMCGGGRRRRLNKATKSATKKRKYRVKHKHTRKH